MNCRWKTLKARLAVCISLVGLLILMSVNATQPAQAQNTLPQFTLVGNAVMHVDRLGLTVNKRLYTGAAWLPDMQQVQNGFEATFDWQINRANPRRGGDGFAFVIHNAEPGEGRSALGGGRNGLGYSGIPNSLAVEFDTVQNPPIDFASGTQGDPNGNHISVQSRGIEPNSVNTDFSLGLTQAEPAIPLFTVGRHTTKIVYKPGNPGNIAIYLDNMERPILNAHVNLAELLSLDEGKAWVGLTAATGGRVQAHDIYMFTFASSEPVQQ